MDYSAVRQNDFSASITITNGYALNCGLYLNNCTGYQVEENTFYSNYDPSNNNTPLGIVVNNSGGENNRIYNNSYEQLYTGILAQNNNKSTQQFTGLELKCNDFLTCEYDIAVTTDTLASNIGIRYNQGANENNRTAPANNIFSYTHNNAESDYFNGCEDLVYWHLSDTITANVKPKKFSNPEVNPQKNTFSLGSFSKSNNCPSSFTTGEDPWWTIDTSNQIIYDAGIKIDSILSLLNLLVDGGDTERLNSEVETSFPDEAMEVRNELIAVSPYLSDSVMLSTIEQENVLTEAMVTEILMANPQSAKSDTVQQTLDIRSSQLSEEQRSDIDQGWFLTGARESLESVLSHYRAIRQQALNNIIRIYLTDSVCVAPTDSIIAMLQNESSLDMQYRLAFTHSANASFSEAYTVLDSIPSAYELSTTQAAQHQQYLACFGLLEQLALQGRSTILADSAQIATLYNIYNNAHGSLQAMARNILVNVDTLQFTEPYILPENSLKEGKIRRVPVRKVYTQSSFKLYPNPAGEYVIIEYRLRGETPQGYVNIIDNRGIIIKAISFGKNHDYMVVPVNDLINGVYYCNFVVNNKSVQTEKLVIFH